MIEESKRDAGRTNMYEGRYNRTETEPHGKTEPKQRTANQRFVVVVVDKTDASEYTEPENHEPRTIEPRTREPEPCTISE